MAWLRTVSGGVLVAALAVSGCSGGGGAKVATLGNGGSSESSSSSSDAKQSFEDALVAYSKCMREHGIDMPDPQFTSNGDGSKGGFAVVGPSGGGGAAPAFDPSSAAYKAADEACKPILDAATKDMPKPSPEELAEQRDKALAFAKCMREHGVDMPDPTFDDSGAISIAVPAPGGADPKAGADPSAIAGPDQAFQDAAKACQQEGGPGFITSGEGPGSGLAVNGATTAGGK